MIIGIRLRLLLLLCNLVVHLDFVYRLYILEVCSMQVKPSIKFWCACAYAFCTSVIIRGIILPFCVFNIWPCLHVLYIILVHFKMFIYRFSIMRGLLDLLIIKWNFDGLLALCVCGTRYYALLCVFGL